MPQTLNLAPVLIPIVTLILGWVIGFFDSNIRTSKKIKEAEKKADLVIAQAQGEAQRAILAAQPSAAQAQPVENSLLKLSVDSKNMPQLFIDGQRADGNNLSPEQRKRLIELMVTMRPWVEGTSAQKTATPARPVAAQTSSLQTPPAAASISQPLPTPAVAAPAAPSKEVAEPTSMVGQIDAILQLRLANTPLASQGIRLSESLQGGVNVFVGAQKYESIADVPNPEVVTLIRSAVAEWEKKYTPGA